MALLPNNVFERNQTAGGRQAVEQAQQRNNAARANTPAQADVAARGNNPPPTPQFLVGGIAGETSQMPQNFGNSGSPGGLDALRAALEVANGGSASGSTAPVSTVGDTGLNPNRRGVPGGPGIDFDREYTLGAGGFEPVAEPPTASAPPSTLAAPPPESIRAPAQGTASAGGTGYQPPNLMDAVEQGVARMGGEPSQAAPQQPTLQETPQAPLQPDVVGSPGYTGGGSGGGTFNVVSSPAGPGGYSGYGVDGSTALASAPASNSTPPRAATAEPQQPGGQLVDEFMQAREAYLNMPSGGGIEGLAERGRALNALRALGGQAQTEQSAQASMYGADQSLRRGIGVADISRDSALGTTAMTQMGGMDRALIQAQTQQRGQDLDFGVGMENANTNRMNAEAQMASAQPTPMDQLVNAATVQQFQSGQLSYPDLVRAANGEAPRAPTPIFSEINGNLIGMQTGSGVQAPNAQLAALASAAGVTTDEFMRYIMNSQQAGQ